MWYKFEKNGVVSTVEAGNLSLAAKEAGVDLETTKLSISHRDPREYFLQNNTYYKRAGDVTR